MIRNLTNLGLRYRFGNIADQFFKEDLSLRAQLQQIDQIKSKQQGAIQKKKRKMPKNIPVQEPTFIAERDVRYKYEFEGIHHVPREVYKAPLKNSYKHFLQKQEYQKFLEVALQTKPTETQSILPEVVDDLWDGQIPIRLLEKFSTKDLFFSYREPDFIATNDRKNNHLKWLSKPYNVHNGPLMANLQSLKEHSAQQLLQVFNPNFFIEEDFYAVDKTAIEKFKLLSQQINQISFQEIPQLALYLAFELKYKIDTHGIWKQLEPVITKHLHHYTIQQLSQLKYALAGTYPKACDFVLHRQILDLTQQELHSLDAEQLMNVITAFRTIQNEKFSDSIIESIKQIKIEDPDLIANVLYSILNAQPKKHQRPVQIDYDADLKKRRKLMEHFIEPLKANISKMSLDTVVRAALSVQLLRLPDFDDVYLHIEHTVLKSLDKLDEFHVSQLLYSFSKGNNGYSVGSHQFYEKLSPLVRKFWSKWGNLTKSRVYFAYTSNSVVIQKDQEDLFLPWIESNAEIFTHSELQNVVYGLMFTGNSSKELWRKIVRNIGYSREIVPLANLYALKQAFYFVQMYYPQWNLKPFTEAMQEAEYQFSILRQKVINEEARELLISIKLFFDYDWSTMQDFNNLYLLNASLRDQKVTLLLQHHRNSLPSGSPRPQLLLQQQILEASDWKAPIINYKEMMSLTAEERKPFLQKIIEAAIEEQKPKYRRWEEERRKEIYTKLYLIDQKMFTPGIKRLTPEDVNLLDRKIE